MNLRVTLDGGIEAVRIYICYTPLSIHVLKNIFLWSEVLFNSIALSVCYYVRVYTWNIFASHKNIIM